MHRKFQPRNFWSCALAWYCREHHLTKHIILAPHCTKNYALHTIRSSHSKCWLRHRHGARHTNLCWVLPASIRKNKLSHHTCIQSGHMVCKFLCQNFSVSWLCIVGKWPFRWMKQYLRLQGRKILKTSCFEFQTFRIFRNLSEFSAVMSDSLLLSVKCSKRRMWRYLPRFIALLYRRVCNWLVICPVVCRFVPYTMPSLHCYRKEHKHFGLTHVRDEQRCVDISVKVAVVVSVNLHHQRFDNFHKTL